MKITPNADPFTGNLEVKCLSIYSHWWRLLSIFRDFLATLTLLVFCWSLQYYIDFAGCDSSGL
jgi:hypothetical protein